MQDALGGGEWIWEVCESCNNGMKDIDEALTVKSPLSILAARELGRPGPYSWVHHPNRPGLLLEARGEADMDGLILYPQIIFEDDKSQMLCDSEDLRRLGPNAAATIFYSGLKRAYDHYLLYGPKARRKHHRNKAMLKSYQINRRFPGERLPPRIFCRNPLSEAKPEIIFELRYHKTGDDKKVLEQLGTFDWSVRGARFDLNLGSDNGTVHFPFSLTNVIRAVAKIGFNLLAFHCPNTQPSITSFPRTVEWITGCHHAAEFGDIRKFGFVHPSDIAPLRCPPKAHAFRLAHDLSTNTWKMYAAFFGGKAGAHVAFRGPNHEPWATIDIISPYKKPFDPPIVDTWYRPIDVQVTTNAFEAVPSVNWTGGDSRLIRTPL